jgi:hypothetical protein
MTARRVRGSGWPVKATEAPALSTLEWGLAAVPAVVLLVMAILQLISFADFRDLLSSMGFAGPTVWAVCIIVAELWGAAGFFRWRLSSAFRYVSYTMAVLAAGFWFVNNLQLISTGMASKLDNSGFFGRFLPQKPSWWTVIEVTILLFWIVYKVERLRDDRAVAATSR